MASRSPMFPQVCRRHRVLSPGYVIYLRWLKRKTVQMERRQARRDPEVVPAYRRFSGHSD